MLKSLGSKFRKALTKTKSSPKVIFKLPIKRPPKTFVKKDLYNKHTRDMKFVVEEFNKVMICDDIRKRNEVRKKASQEKLLQDKLEKI